MRLKRAICGECDWTATALTARDAATLLERHYAENHNTVPWME